MIREVKWICAFVFLSFFADRLSASPFESTLNGQVEKIFSALPGETIRLNIVLAGGRHEFSFTRVESELGLDSEQLLLFKGRRLARVSDREAQGGAALDVINNNARLRFFNRRGRLVTVSAPLRTKHRKKAAVAFLSNSRQLGCGTKDSGVSLAQVRPQLASAASSFKPRVLEVAVDADSDFFDVYKARTAAEMEAVLSAASVVYTEQLGITIKVVAQNQFEEKSKDPYSGNDPDAILEQFQDYTAKFKHLGRADAFLLFTGKKMTDSVVGLAYLGAVCSDGGRFSFGINQRVSSAGLQMVIAAHEIGHLVGARHDDITPSLMSSFVTAQNNRFSNLSLGEINEYLEFSDECLLRSVPLRVRLSELKLRSRANKALSLEAGIKIRGEYQGCSLSVFGTTKKSQLSGQFFSAEPGQVALFSRPARGLIKLSATIQEGTSSRLATGYLRAVVSCPSGEVAFSELRPFKALGYGQRSKLNPIFQLLGESLGQSARNEVE